MNKPLRFKLLIKFTSLICLLTGLMGGRGISARKGFLTASGIHLFIIFLCFFGNLNDAFADGSKDLISLGKGVRVLMFSNRNSVENQSFPFKTLGTHYVYVKEGEYLTVASSAQGLGNKPQSGTIFMTSPDGVVTSTRMGKIANRTQEMAGPLIPNAAPTGNFYQPYSFRIDPGQGGIWKIEFTPAGDPDSGKSNPAAQEFLTYTNWTQALDEFIVAWDISVRNVDNTSWLPGRVYANVLNLCTSGDFEDDTKSYYGTNYF